MPSISHEGDRQGSNFYKPVSRHLYLLSHVVVAKVSMTFTKLPNHDGRLLILWISPPTVGGGRLVGEAIFSEFSNLSSGDSRYVSRLTKVTARVKLKSFVKLFPWRSHCGAPTQHL